MSINVIESKLTRYIYREQMNLITYHNFALPFRGAIMLYDSKIRMPSRSLEQCNVEILTVSTRDQLEEYCETVTGTSEISALREKVAPLFHKAVIAEDYSEAQHLLSALGMSFPFSFLHLVSSYPRRFRLQQVAWYIRSIISRLFSR